jgi:hypothetical protein
MRLSPSLLTVALGVFLAGCSKPTNPIGPSSAVQESGAAVPGQAGQSADRVSILRVVEGGSGGGEQCLAIPPETEGRITITAGDTNLAACTNVPPTSDPLEFTISGPMSVQRAPAGNSELTLADGHITHGTYRLSVASGVGTVSLTLVGESTTLAVSGSGPVTQSISTCSFDYRSVTTRLTLQLKYLGRTAITEVHRIPCTS